MPAAARVHTSSTRRPRAGLAITASALAIAAGCSIGCSSNQATPSSPKPQELDWSAFINAQPASGAPATGLNSALASPTLDSDSAPFVQAEPTADQLSPRIVDVTSLIDAPAQAPTGRAASASRPLVLESKVGQINGRPVLASEILEPLDGRLSALALKARSPAEWAAGAQEEIERVLEARVADELMLAEAQSNLTAQQRQGLFAFLEQLQENLKSAEGGSALQADEALRESTGRSLAEEARDRLDRELIRNEFRTKVEPRINISWRQVRQEYDRRVEQFNPNPTVTFSMIRVNASDAAAVDRVTRALQNATTEQFLEIARSEDNQFVRNSAGQLSLQLKTELAQATVFGPEVLNQAARKLDQGQTAGPLHSRPEFVEWIHLVQVDRVESVPLYDAQLTIQSELYNRRFQAEQGRYLIRLLSRGSYSNIKRMQASLMEIAIQRYLPDGSAK